MAVPSRSEAHLPVMNGPAADPGKWPYSSRYKNPRVENLRVIDAIVREGQYYHGNVSGIIRVGSSQADFKTRGLFAAVRGNLEGQLGQDAAQHERIILLETKIVVGWALGVERDCWMWLLQALDIPPAFILLMSNANQYTGSFHSFTSRDPETNSVEAYHILVKRASGGFVDGSFYLRVESQSKKWTLLAISDDATRQDQSVLLNQFYTDHQNESHHPLLAVLRIVQIYQSALYQRNRYYVHMSAVSEVSTGLGSLAYNSTTHTKPEDLDVKMIHWIAGNLRVANSALMYQVDLLSFLHNCCQELRAFGTEWISELDFEEIERAFSSLRTEASMRHRGGLVSMERAQAQLDGVRMLIDQAVAKQSTQLADQSGKIAIESAKIAEETRVDSNAMKTIAGVTMMYLPATFMATIFSTVFFRIDQATNHFYVDRRFWIYLVASLTLTVITVTVWRLLTNFGMPTLKATLTMQMSKKRLGSVFTSPERSKETSGGEDGNDTVVTVAN